MEKGDTLQFASQTVDEDIWRDSLAEEFTRHFDWVDSSSGNLDETYSFSVVSASTQEKDTFAIAIKLVGPKESPFAGGVEYSGKAVIKVADVLEKHFEWELAEPLKQTGKPDLLVSGSSKIGDNSIREVCLVVCNSADGTIIQSLRFKMKTGMRKSASRLVRAVSGISSAGTSSASVRLRARSEKTLKQLSHLTSKANIEDMDNLDRAHHRLRSVSKIFIDDSASGLTGEQQLALMTTTPPNMEQVHGISSAAPNEMRTGSSRPVIQRKKHSISRHLLRIVVLEDEYQLMSCVSLPLTIFFFLVFMVFFQVYYRVPEMYMAESIIRESVCAPAMDISQPTEIFDWMRDVYFPYFMALGENDRSPLEKQMTLVGGWILTTARSEEVPCDEEGWGSEWRCRPEALFGGVPQAGVDWFAQAREWLGYGEVLMQNQPVRRRLAQESQPPSSSDDLPAPRPRGVFPSVAAGKAKNLAIKHWPQDMTPAPWRRAAAQTRERTVRESAMMAEARSPRREVRRLEERWLVRRNCSVESPGHHVARPVSGERSDPRRLKATRPEMREGLPNPAMGSWVEGVHELKIPMSFELEFVQDLVNQMHAERLLANTTLFWSLRTVVHNERIGRGLASLVTVHFRFSRGGNIYAQCDLNTLVLNVGFGGYGFAAFWFVCLVGTSGSIFLSALQSWKHGFLLSHFKRLWNCLEWFLVFFGWFVVSRFLLERIAIDAFNSNYQDYTSVRHGKLTDPESTVFTILEYDKEAFPPLFEKFKTTAVQASWLQTFVTYYHILLLARYVVASRGQPKLAIVVRTMRFAAVDLLHLFVVFSVIFAAYVFSGHILFGRRMEEFATLRGALAETMYIILAREYEWDRFTEQDLFTVMAWVWSFLLLVVLVMVNIMLAMIFEAHGDIRSGVSDHDTVWNTMGHFFTHLKLLSTWVTNPEIIRWLLGPAAHEQQITIEMLKAQFPTMPSKQLQHLFKQARFKHEIIVIRGNQNALPETIASTLIGVDQMRGGVRLIKGEAEKYKRQTDPGLSMSGMVSKRGSMIVPRSGDNEDVPSIEISPEPSENEASPAEVKSEVPVLGEDYAIRPPVDPPRWCKVGLLPHLKKQTSQLNDANLQLGGIEGRLHVRRGVGDSSDSLPLPRPTNDPWAYDRPRVRDRDARAAPVLGTTGGREKFLVQPPPLTRAPAKTDVGNSYASRSAVSRCKQPGKKKADATEAANRESREFPDDIFVEADIENHVSV